ncbi:MAG: MerR family transcriptional regulator [Candidatus Thorarchaeota archaeon SMTZ1-83]
MFSVSQAARRLYVCPKTIRHWDSQGRIHCIRSSGNHRRIPLTQCLILRIPLIVSGICCLITSS